MGLARVSAGRFASAEEVEALVALIGWLKAQDYRFVTITPASHQRVLARRDSRPADDLRDVFGWNVPFTRDLLPGELLATLENAGLVDAAADGLCRSRVRVSSLGCDLFVHSAYPTDEANAVFFGPDSYRFAGFVESELGRHGSRTIGSIADIGTGSGVGAIVAGRLRPGAALAGTDVNRRALAFAEVNAAAAGLAVRLEHADTLDALGQAWDLILANPPYMIDASARAYRDGGDALGAAVSLAMTRDALRHLAPGGLFLLYTGSTVVRGHGGLRAELERIAAEHGMALDYREIDPDVFGEELATPAYREADRIAVVGATFARAT
jgi:methylase of polypeptide subunit release factors